MKTISTQIHSKISSTDVAGLTKHLFVKFAISLCPFIICVCKCVCVCLYIFLLHLSRTLTQETDIHNVLKYIRFINRDDLFFELLLF